MIDRPSEVTRATTGRSALTMPLAVVLALLLLSTALLSLGGGSAPAGAADGKSRAVPFKALHIYYISPTGDDQKAGTSPRTAWATPKHDVNCGDVIIVEPGNYVLGKYSTPFGPNDWGRVSNCPSASGGVDGTGGVYFAVLLCAGPKLGACTVNAAPNENSAALNNEAIRVDQSNWAVEGFVTTQSPASPTGCMMATSESNDVIAFVAFINNIATTCGIQGFSTVGWTATGGVDQTAVVGAIAYNTSPSMGGNCASGVSIIPTSGTAPTPGTHIFVAGEFAYKNIADPSGAGCHTDGEGLVFDSWACLTTGYRYQGVAEQNVWWYNGSAGFEAFPNTRCNSKSNPDIAQVIVFGNTSYDNGQDALRVDPTPELLLSQLNPVSGSTIYRVTNNIFQAAQATAGNNGKAPVFGAGVYINNNTPSPVSITGNYIWQSNPGTRNHFWEGTPKTSTTPGNPNTDVWINSHHDKTSFPFGSNIYNDPGFANPKGLPTGPPDCSDFTNTTACMNEGYHVAADLKPTVAVGYGYQPPGPCRADPYYPTWLKGVVFLLWDGSNLTENDGLITKPCNL